jgi:uncharacterized protein (TIGR03435 family)
MRCTLLLFAPALLSAQLSFEVASIKSAPPQEMGRISVHRSTDEGRLNYENVSLSDLICTAYNVLHRQVTGPEWLENQRFDIKAKYPEGGRESQVPEMLKSLLADRFGLKLHEESKEMSLYAIMPAKTGVKMKKAETGGNFNVSNGKALSHIAATATMAALADTLSGRMDRPVVDQSGLEGPWTIDLQWAPDTGGAPVDDPTAPSLFTAMQEQLGLRLVATKGPVKFLVVDHIEKSPSEN